MGGKKNQARCPRQGDIFPVKRIPVHRRGLLTAHGRQTKDQHDDTSVGLEDEDKLDDLDDPPSWVVLA